MVNLYKINDLFMPLQDQYHELKEGRFYQFRILHEINMPPDDEPFYVLESETGSRHLLLKSYYSHYQFIPGMEIRCKVDKVNCSGKIFLEPDHPFCKPGDLLHFNFTSTFKVINSSGEEENLLLLTDPWEQQAFLQVEHPVNYNNLNGGITCKVERIKKGKLLISDPERNYFGAGKLPDAAEPFTIKEVRTLAPKMEYYILNQGDSVHYLRTKYFSQYGFEIGDRIHLRVLGKPELFQHYLEPYHPFYTPGEIYSFDVVRTEKNSVSDNGKDHTLIIKDALGHEYPIPMQGEESRWIEKVNIRVLGIRMSKCLFGEISI